ncbi:MAG TPA: peptidoglycan synthetase, partial [Chitinophagaceae bacterium]
LVAVLELHTYSSLNEQFMQEYAGSMDPADEAVVFYSKHALELKRMPDLPPEKVREGFGKQNLQVFNRREELEEWLRTRQYEHTNLLLMSSGNYDGLDVTTFANTITQNN